MAVKQHGSALISALLIMTLVTITAVAMCTLLQQNIQRTQVTINTDRLYLATQAVVLWAKNRLSQLDSMPAHALHFPKKYQRISPNMLTQGQLIDLESRFNLNTLVIAAEKNNLHIEAQTVLFRLMHAILDQSHGDQSGSIIQATNHWVNSLAPGHDQDDLGRYYLQCKPPYSPSHQPMQSLSEFRLVRGVTPGIYKQLSPYLSALPIPSRINLNTVSPALLQALAGAQNNESDVRALIQARGNDGIKTLDAIEPLLKKLNLSTHQITLESHYFLCITSVKNHDRELVRYTILQREADKSGQWVVSVLHDNLNDL